MAFGAGLDIELPADDCAAHLGEAVRRGLISVETIDAIVRRILTEKLRLGLFERPYVDEGAIELQAPATVALAREVARQGVVVLENDGILPLDPGRGQRIAVIGPTADDPLALLCGYSFPVHLILNDAGEAAAQVVTPRAAFEKAFGAGRVAYARGCFIIEERKYGSPVFPGDVEKSTTLEQVSPVSRRTDLIPAAVACARGGGRRRGVRRGPGGPVPDRHRGRGLRCRLARPARRPAAAPRGSGRDGEAGGGGSHERPPVQPGRAGGQGRCARDGLRGRPGGRARARRRADRQGGAFGPALRLRAEERRRRPLLLQPQDEERRHADRAALRQPLPVRPRPRLHAVRVRRPDARRGGGGRRRPARSALRFTVRNTGSRAGWRCRSSTCGTFSPRWCGRSRSSRPSAGSSCGAGESARVAFEVPTDMLCFTGMEGRRIVEPGEFELQVGASSADIRLRATRPR